jgi:hypothetical protein
MSTTSLKEKLIDKIRQTADEALLEEISNLIELQEPDSIYVLNSDQKKAIEEAKEQISKGDFISNEEADNHIDEWLKK